MAENDHYDDDNSDDDDNDNSDDDDNDNSDDAAAAAAEGDDDDDDDNSNYSNEVIYMLVTNWSHLHVSYKLKWFSFCTLMVKRKECNDLYI